MPHYLRGLTLRPQSQNLTNLSLPAGLGKPGIPHSLPPLPAHGFPRGVHRHHRDLTPGGPARSEQTRVMSCSLESLALQCPLSAGESKPEGGGKVRTRVQAWLCA